MTEGTKVRNGTKLDEFVLEPRYESTKPLSKAVRFRTAPRTEVSTPDHRAAVRQIIEKADPAMLAFCDMAKERFGAKLAGLALKNTDGTVSAIGALHNGKPDGR